MLCNVLEEVMIKLTNSQAKKIIKNHQCYIHPFSSVYKLDKATMSVSLARAIRYFNTCEIESDVYISGKAMSQKYIISAVRKICNIQKNQEVLIKDLIEVTLHKLLAYDQIGFKTGVRIIEFLDFAKNNCAWPHVITSGSMLIEHNGNLYEINRAGNPVRRKVTSFKNAPQKHQTAILLALQST